MADDIPPPNDADDNVVKLGKRRRTNGGGSWGAEIPIILDGRALPVGPVEWLWRGWVAKGMIHVLAGSPGVGKSTIAFELAAILSSGGRWPDDQPSPEPCKALIWSGEDPWREVIGPRLIAAGAELANIRFIAGMQSGASGVRRPFDPTKDFAAIAHTLREDPSIKLLILDPLVAIASAKTDGNSNVQSRGAMLPLCELAAETGVAVLGVHHFTKGTEGRAPIDRISGSVAWGAVARMVLAVVPVKEVPGTQRLTRPKSNIGSTVGGFDYNIVPYILPNPHNFEAARIQWADVLSGSAQELMDKAEGIGQPDGRNSAERNECLDFLREALGEGPAFQKDLEKSAKSQGLSFATVRRAKAQLGVRSERDPNDFGPFLKRKWVWTLTTIPEQ